MFVMRSREAHFSNPLNIDVAHLASFYPEFRYRGPIPKGSYSDEITSEYIMNDADQSNRFGFLQFDDKSEVGFGSVRSDFPPSELAVLFARLPDELSFELISALQGTALEIPKLSASQFRAAQQELAEKAEKFEKLQRIKSPLHDAHRVDFKPEESACILQHEYGVTKADAAQPVLGTYGAGPCVILALYDKQAKTAVLTHIDALTNLYSLNQLFNEINPETTVAHLAGGDSSSQEMCIKIIDMLEDRKINIANADIVREGFKGPASLAIDARTGNIYAPVSPFQLSNTKDQDVRLQLAGMQIEPTPLRRSYDWSRPLHPEQMLHREQSTSNKSHKSVAHSSLLPGFSIFSLLSPRQTDSLSQNSKNDSLSGLTKK